MSAGGNISGHDVTLKFNQDGNGSILNTGSITASGTLSVDTHTLTNQANQVDVGEIWQKVDGGYLKTTGTTVQPGGFMSAVNMDLNVQTLNQIGGALQKLAADGTIDESGTQQALAALQQQLGGNFTQTALSDNLHQDFVKEGGSFGMALIGALVAAIAVSLITYGAASAAIGATLGAEGGTFAAATAATAAAPAMSAGLGNVVLSAAIAGFTSSAASQFVGTGKIALSSAFEAAAVAAFTAGLTNGITYNAQSGLGFTTQPIALGTGTQSLASLAGVKPLGCVASAVSGSGCGGGAIGGAVSAMTANGIATAVTGGQGVSDQVQLAAIVTATSLLGGAAAALLGQNALAAMTAAQNETLNNTCAPGHNCGTLTSAIKDTGRAAWNTAVGTVEAIPNFVNGALPGYPDYVPFLSDATLPYDDPDFGSLVSFLVAVGVASKTGGGKSTVTNSGATGTVWDSITATQPNYPGSVIPQSFELSLPNGQSVWVHGNATEHMAEYAQMVANDNPPGVVRLTTQQQLSSLQSAVNTATQGGVPYNQLIKVGGWELKFSPPRQPGQLPALIHALHTGK
ncbi:adhesin [Burkholderia multivorans]|nr:adhesin [Burkholderia multivorans]CAB5309287.1 adhesin [Burkholderia multivorans]CAB5315776.1 adhesin [Burkholderia multivorans]CAB5321816.1 adhesin [Burkholderia multivorans]CAB5323472.1 adhesin [Burkholderia multivorans]